MGSKDLMYFDEKIAADFAAQEQSEKGFSVGNIMDQVIMHTVGHISDNFHAAELGGGAHPDRYNRFFEALIKRNGSIDWVDNSPYMLSLAKQYIDTENLRERLKVINFIEKDMLDYMEQIEDKSLDLVIMKYTIDYFTKSEQHRFFALLEKKLKDNGALVSTIGILQPVLKSISTHGRYFYKGDSFPDHETKDLKDGDQFTIKFFLEAGKPYSGYIPGAETTKYYHSEESYRELAKQHNFTIYIGDWKRYMTDATDTTEQNILVLKK